MQSDRQQQDPTEAIQKLHNAASERRRNPAPSGVGGCQEGAPGYRGPTYYFSYFCDLEGNKLCAYCTRLRSHSQGAPPSNINGLGGSSREVPMSP